MTTQEYLTHMTEDMELRGLSERSRKVYCGAVSQFLKYCKEQDYEAGEVSFRQFILSRFRSGKVSKTTCNLYNSAIRFFLEVTLEQDINRSRTSRFRKEYHYPEVFTIDEVTQFFSVIDDTKYRAIFLNIYGSGLRASEIGNLHISDVDSKNMRLLIRQGKGKKDRYTILSTAGLAALREYWKAYRPSSEQGYLFPGKHEGHLGVSGVETAFRKYYCKSGLTKRATVHTLRHSFATHLLENGADPLYIKNLLGHTTMNSTNIYLHVANTPIYKTVSPLDKVITNG